MTDAAAETRSVVVEREIPCPPEKIWRALTEPHLIEEWKWRGVPVWSHGGILCTGETYKTAVKLTFAKGAALDDPKGLFNSSLDGNTRRAIDIHEGEPIDEGALKALIRGAAALNTSARAAARPARSQKRTARNRLN